MAARSCSRSSAGERAEHVLHDLLRQVGREVGQFVGIELFGCGDQFLRLHRSISDLAHRIRHFEQDFAVALGLDQVPDQQALVERQRFEDVGDVGRVHRVELRAARCGAACAPGSRPVRGAACPGGAPGPRRASAARAILHFAQAVLHVVLVVRLVAFGRGVGWLAHGGSRRGPPL
jgi:hypothetical protein